MPAAALLTCPAEPLVPTITKDDADGQQRYEDWNENVRGAGAECRSHIITLCNWYVYQGAKITCDIKKEGD